MPANILVVWWTGWERLREIYFKESVLEKNYYLLSLPSIDGRKLRVS